MWNVNLLHSLFCMQIISAKGSFWQISITTEKIFALLWSTIVCLTEFLGHQTVTKKVTESTVRLWPQAKTTGKLDIRQNNSTNRFFQQSILWPSSLTPTSSHHCCFWATHRECPLPAGRRPNAPAHLLRRGEGKREWWQGERGEGLGWQQGGWGRLQAQTLGGVCPHVATGALSWGGEINRLSNQDGV